MKRAAIVIAILLATAIPVVVVVLRGRGSDKRTPEGCTKDAVFCVQRATRRAAEADDFEALVKLEESLREEGRRLEELLAEFATMPPPSRWERSRMRKHRALAETAVDAWSGIADELRVHIEGGAVPPHVRMPLLDAIDEFNSARRNAWAILILESE